MQDPRSLPSKAARKEAETVTGIVGSIRKEVSAGHPADRALAAIYKDHREFGSRDRRFFSAAVFSYFRWKGWTEALDLEPASAVAISYFLDAEIMHPAASLLAESAGLPADQLLPLGRQPLADKAAALAQWFGRPEPPPIRDLVPTWVIDTLHMPQDNPTEEDLETCIAAFQERPPTWVRAPGMVRQDNPFTALMEGGYRPHRHNALRHAIAIYEPFNLREMQGRTGVHFEVQDLASQCVGIVCSPTTGSPWWDACAGGGGKALHLADLMEDNGEILATDIRPETLIELERRARRARIRSIHPEAMDVVTAAGFEQAFDGVLVDAPCSGVGTWSRNPDARWRTSPDDIGERASQQAELLRKTAPAVRSGGVLVYAVCTLTEAETTTVVKDFLDSNAEFSLDPAPHPLTAEKTDGTMWIWPSDGPCDGMFIARIRRA